MFIKYGDTLLLCFFSSFSFLTPNPITQCSDSCGASHGERGTSRCLETALAASQQGRAALRERESRHRVRPWHGERSWLYTQHSVNVSRHNRRPLVNKAQPQQKQEPVFKMPRTGGVCTVRARVLLLRSNCPVISGKISPTGKCTKLTNHHFFN